MNKELQQQWDHAANLHLGDIVITKFSGRTAWWSCDQCPDGHPHRWQAVIDRRSRGAGCPQCSGRKLCKHNSLATLAPAVAAFWDSGKNGCTADMVLAGSNQPAHWHCSTCTHDWVAKPASKTHDNSGCPKCNQGAPGKRRMKHPTFAHCQHPLLAEWDHDRNTRDGFSPAEVTLGSTKQVHWLCSHCPLGQQHSWTAKPCSRVSLSSGCPFCAGKAVCKCNSLQTLFPSIAAEWHHELNHDTPNDYTAGSHFVAWWQSRHKGCWQQSINSRTSKVVQEAAQQQYLQHNP